MLYVEYAVTKNGSVQSASPIMQTVAQDITVRDTVSSSVLRGFERGTELLPNDDEEEEAEETGTEATTQVYLSLTRKD